MTDSKDASTAPRPDLKDIRDMARWLITKGQTPLPLPNGQKKPLLPGWQNATIPAERIDELFGEGSNIGLRLDVWTDLDLDAPEARFIAPSFIKKTAAYWGRESARYSHHLYDVENSHYEKFEDPLLKDRKNMILEIRHDNGHQSMLPPSVHPSGELVRWEGSTSPTPEKWAYADLRRAAGKIAAAVLLIRHMKPGTEHSVWLFLSGAMARAEWKKEDVEHFCGVVTHAARDEKAANRLAAVEDSFKKKDENASFAGLKKLAEFLPKEVVAKLGAWLDLRRVSIDSPDLSDYANAWYLFAELGEDLRYIPTEGKGGLWLHWNATIWQRDRAAFVYHLAAEALKRKADRLIAASKNGKFIDAVQRELLNVAGVNAAIEKLSWYPEISVGPGVFDSNPWLVGLENGVYNLKADRLETGTREHLVSRQMRASFEPRATAPRWQVCLERAQPDGETRAFLQRLAGACLIGMQTEHGMIFNYGKGSNFKTAYAEVLRRALGDDYAATPNEELFFKGNHEVPRNYLADIHGMRLLTTNEKDDDSKWNVEFIKRLFGGQELNGCRKYCESFGFVPTARVIAAANNRPRLTEIDEAIRRRFLLVPWEEKIPIEGEVLKSTETDPSVILAALATGGRMPFEQLMTLLLEESSGYLNWALAGARDFIARGLRLAPPKFIQEATEKYFSDEDFAGRFVKEWTTVTSVPSLLNDAEKRKLLGDPAKGTSSDQLHEAFTIWAKFGKYTWVKRKLSLRLEKVDGVATVRGNGNRMLFNLVLTPEAQAAVAAAREGAPF